MLDEDERFRHLVNEDSVVWRCFDEGDGEAECIALIRRHEQETRSSRDAAILKDWPRRCAFFVEIVPKEILALELRKLAAAE